MTADTLLSRLEAVRQSPGKQQWTARCPAHPDRHPSLAISEKEDGRVLVFCRAGCSAVDILAAVGLEFSDLFPPRPATDTHLLPERRPVPAADLLALLARESDIVCMAAREMLESGDLVLSVDDHARLELASARIHRARAMTGGYRHGN
jgi:hypothetical protein